MKTFSALVLGFRRVAPFAALALGVACDPGSSTGNFTGAGGGGAGQGGSGAGSIGGSSDGGNTGQFMNGPGGGGPGNCDTTPEQDVDMDGFTGAQGDCNDCDPNSNPGAIEVIPDDMGEGGGGPYVPVDEDCDGTADNLPPASCDEALLLDSADAMDAARAIELCKQAVGDTDWGVVNAQYVRADGAAAASSLQNGILTNFGPNVLPRGGARILGLSSGHARIVGQPGACNSCNCFGSGVGTPPSAAYPQNAPGCTVDNTINDDVAVELTLRAPTNATGYQFDFKFYSFEYPDWLCTNFNDQFMALVTPPPMGALDGNVSFDSMGAPVSVNVAGPFFTVCGVGPSACADGPGEMDGTGFDIWSGTFDDGQAGGTAWLQTTAPVEGGSTFSIRYGIWDTGDDYLDSTSVIDNFKWIASGGTVTIGTEPIPE